MPGTTTLHVRVDERVKEQATEVLAAMGLSVSDAVRTLLTRVAVDKRLPFEEKRSNAESRAAIAEAREIARAHAERFASAAELFDDLQKNTG